MTVKDRIKRFCKAEGIAISAFEKNIGVSNGYVNAISRSIGVDNLNTIIEKYSILNIEWLLTGRGEMLKTKGTLSGTPTDGQPYLNDKDTNNNLHTQGKITEFSKVHPASTPEEGIPLIPFSAMAGALTGEQTAFEYECERYVVPAFNGADFLMQVKGNSMMPTYISGDIVACRRVPMSGLFFQWNKPYVLDTSQGAIIKRIKPGSDKNHILIVSDNKEYEPFELPYEDIYAVALVIGIIRLE